MLISIEQVVCNSMNVTFFPIEGGGLPAYTRKKFKAGVQNGFDTIEYNESACAKKHSVLTICQDESFPWPVGEGAGQNFLTLLFLNGLHLPLTRQPNSRVFSQ